MFVVDLLHEFELGVAKAVIIQLIRILYSIGAEKVSACDKRYISASNFDNEC
jgi:hypothetical protein